MLSVALRKKYLMIIKPKKITKPFNQYLYDFFSTNLVIKYTAVTSATNKTRLIPSPDPPTCHASLTGG